MPVPFSCSGCGFQTKVKDALAGKKIKCPKCGAAGVVAAPSAAKTGESSHDLLSVNLGSFDDVVPEEGEELPAELAPKGKKPAKPKKKKGPAKYVALSGAVKGAAVGFSLLSIAVIALLVMFVLPEVTPLLESSKTSETPPPPPPAGG